VAERNTTLGIKVVDKRASLLATGNLLSEAAIDKYSFARDAYLQYRRNQIYDGNPPDEPDLPDPSADPVPTQ
jgi:phospholipid-binding lipoprotein MlaA